jgi:Tfp pilus assembly protein PilO
VKGSTRILLTVLALALVATGVALLVFRPLGQRVESDRAAIKERRDQLVKLERVARRISDVQKEIDQLQGALEFFDHRLPKECEIDIILREVWVIAEARSLAARSIRTLKADTTSRANAQPISLALEGPFNGFYTFLLALEQLPRITKIREMQIQQSPTEPGSVMADVVVDIFFEK